jgi:O-antigen/teichoic acid export membrane protein
VSATRSRNDSTLDAATHASVTGLDVAQAGPASQGLSLRSNFAWMLAGNAVFAICQLGMIVSLARLGNSFIVGQFSLGLAISTPVLMFTNLNLRAVQATDVRRLYSFGEYFQLRFVMSAIALVAIATVARAENVARTTALVILAVSLAKAIDALSDIHYGLFQLNERLDQTGRSMILRGLISVGALSAVLYCTRSILWSCVALALAWLGALIGWDSPQAWRLLAPVREHRQIPRAGGLLRVWRKQDRIRRQWSLLRLSLPLGIVTTLASINLNMPRYFIAARSGEHELGIFSALAYATVSLTLISDSLGHCVIPKLSRLYDGGNIAAFQCAVLKLSGIGIALGSTALAAVQLAGKRLLGVFYGPEYSGHSQAFVLLMLAAAIHCVAAMLTSGILAARRFRIQVVIFSLVAATTALACYRMVPAMGLTGGAWGMVAGAVMRLILAALVLGRLILAGNDRKKARAIGITEWSPSL